MHIQRIHYEINLLKKCLHEFNENKLKIYYKSKIFLFYFDENYPFYPPIKIYCNNKNITLCNINKEYCFVCQSILCSNWSPSYHLTDIMDEYIWFHNEKEKQIVYTIWILNHTKLAFQNDIIQHICNFLF